MLFQILLISSVLLLALALRFPVMLAVALPSTCYFLFYDSMPEIAYIQSMMAGLDKTVLTAIPYYFLLGAIMSSGGMAARLLDFARAMLSWCRGGLSQVNIGASILFGGISGSAVADASAIGSIMIPAMKKDGYSSGYAAAVTASSASIGLLIPPSIPMVLFGIFNNVSVGNLFLAGLIPGFMMGGFLMLAAFWVARARKIAVIPWAGWKNVRATFKRSFMVLLLPVLISVSLGYGVASASEVGALAVLYAVLLSVFVYRDISLRKLFAITVKSAADSAGILCIIAVGGGLLWILASMGAADQLVESVSSLQLSSKALLCLIALLLIVSGTLLGPGLLLILVVPAFTPLVVASGIDVLHFGVVAVLSSSIGLVTPPVGILIFLTAAQSAAPVKSIIKEMLPFYLALAALLITLINFPVFSTALPSLL